MLRGEGWEVNHKRVWRLYRAAGPGLRRRRGRHVHREAPARPAAEAPNQEWAMDVAAVAAETTAIVVYFSTRQEPPSAAENGGRCGPFEVWNGVRCLPPPPH